MSILGVLLIVAVLYVVVVLLAMLSRPSTEPDFRSVRFVSWAAMGTTIVAAGAGIIGAVTAFIPGSSLTYTTPIAPERIELLEGVELQGVTSHLDRGVYSQADITSTTFSGFTRFTGGIGVLCVAAVWVMIALMVWLVCRRLLAGTPFDVAVSRIATVTAAVVLVVGFAGDILMSIAGWHAGVDVFDGLGWTDGETASDPLGSETGYPHANMAITLPVWPLAAAFVIAVFGTLVKFGSRVQRERDDLEVETAELRRDTEGLV